MPTERTLLGSAAESAVAQHLERLGWRILDRNWRRPWGELDLVASHGPVIHVIEVKASTVDRNGFSPVFRADRVKMAKVRRTAETWLSQHGYGRFTEWQMDVASVIMGGTEPAIELIENI